MRKSHLIKIRTGFFMLLFFVKCGAVFSANDSTVVKLSEAETKKIISQTLDSKSIKESMLRDVSANACKCIDSINVVNKSQKTIAEEISKCINEEVSAYQTTMKILEGLKGDKNSNTIIINTDKGSKEYIQYYREIEKRLMDSCKSIKRVVAAENKQSKYSGTDDPEALEQYNRGAQLSDKGIYQEAITYYEKAVRLDPMFVFAWDNLAICYRKTNQIDKSIEAYQQSLKINPYGEVPLQNIAVAYEYKKEYDKSIEAYQLYLKNYPDAVEAYYGIGRILFFYKNEEEEALENMCKAYNLYTKMSSPYRVDAEKVISQIYAQMKKQKKEKKFNEILKRNHLSPQ